MEKSMVHARAEHSELWLMVDGQRSTVLDLSKNLDDLSWEKHRVLGSMTKLQFLEDSKEKIAKELVYILKKFRF